MGWGREEIAKAVEGAFFCFLLQASFIWVVTGTISGLDDGVDICVPELPSVFLTRFLSCFTMHL
jgi:hypothetical protein